MASRPSSLIPATSTQSPITTCAICQLWLRGPQIHWVKADFRDRLKEKFNTAADRSENQQRFIARNHEWIRGKDYSSGNAFLDLIMWKGRVPAAKSQFCTEFLKLRPIQRWLEEIRGDQELINYVGIRAAESLKRAKMDEEEFSNFFDCLVKRPLLRWTTEQVFPMLEKHGVPPNPLYAAGLTRVGCFPCIHARKSELARLPDWAWAKLEEWEGIIGRSWFPPGMIPLSPEKRKRRDELREMMTAGTHAEDLNDLHRELEAIQVPTTSEARLWSKTTRGGQQLDLMAPDAADVPSCMSTWGVCE
jgi:3'-phosphoadenosine 5'-phosphosulfate sulfotransferase (PAPS reductase)/FAD synthetase